MTALQRRLFIFADEWLGVVLLLYLHRQHDPAFWYVLIAWAVMVYCISYPIHWLKQAAEADPSAKAELDVDPMPEDGEH